MKVLLIDPDVLEPLQIETPGGLEEWRRLIDCSLIDVASRRISGQYYDFIIDDEGLLKGRKVTALDSAGNPMLSGPLVICRYDGKGGEMSLTAADIQAITEKIVIVSDKRKPGEKWLAVSGIEY